jgi:hypothetical protein
MGLFRKQTKTAQDEMFKEMAKLLSSVERGPEYQAQRDLYDSMINSMCANGVDSDEMPGGTGEFGLAATNPVPCKTVFGSIAYLSRLRAPDGRKVLYSRIGSVRSPASAHPIDKYEIGHPLGKKLADLYISPYGKRNSGKAPRGFTLTILDWYSDYKYADIFIAQCEKV